MQQHSVILAESTKPQLSDTSSFMDPEIEVGIKDCELSREGLEKTIMMKRRVGEFLQAQHSYEDLKRSISEILKIAFPEYNPNLVTKILIESAKNYVNYFRELGLSDEEAKGYALAFSTYTGPEDAREEDGVIGIWNNNSLGINSFLHLAFNSADFTEDSPHLIFASFLLKALNSLPTFTEISTRALDLSPEDNASYQEGKIITLTGFNSSSEGQLIAPSFTGRNARFIIYSRTGRSIANFSNHPEEKEVLFAPTCTLMVVKKEIKNSITFIYLREVELGLTEDTILWVDERIEKRVEKRMDQRVDERMNKRVDERMDKRVDEGMDKRVDKRIDKRFDDGIKDYEYKKILDKVLSQEHQTGLSLIQKSSQLQALTLLEWSFAQQDVLQSVLRNKTYKVVTIHVPELPRKTQNIDVDALIEFLKNLNFNIKPPFPEWIVQTREEALESLYKQEEAECQDRNLQKKQARRSYNIQEDEESKAPFWSTSQSDETAQIKGLNNYCSVFSSIAMSQNLNSGPDNGSLRDQALASQHYYKDP